MQGAQDREYPGLRLPCRLTRGLWYFAPSGLGSRLPDIVAVRQATIQFRSNRVGYVRYVLGFRVWPFCIWGCFWDLGAVVMLVPGLTPPPVVGGGPGGGPKRARALAESQLHY